MNTRQRPSEQILLLTIDDIAERFPITPERIRMVDQIHEQNHCVPNIPVTKTPPPRSDQTRESSGQRLP